MNTYDLERFVKAQQQTYATALREIQSGRKKSHWMWYIFPQAAGLGRSEMSAYFALQSLDEAKAYANHPVLGARLTEMCNALLALDTTNAGSIFGFPDNLKLQSSMTLFALACPQTALFQKVLDKYYNGQKDGATLRILNSPR